MDGSKTEYTLAIHKIKAKKIPSAKVQYDQVKFVLHLVVVIITQSYSSGEKVEKDKEFEGNNRIKIIFIL